jgi:cell division protease FtsH
VKKFILLAVVVAAGIILPALLFFASSPSGSALSGAQPMPYSQFLDEVAQNRIESVAINPERTQARITSTDGTVRGVVNLPQDPALLDTLTSKGVDISIQPIRDDGTALQLFKPLSIPLLLPLLLIGTLFFLAVREMG